MEGEWAVVQGGSCVLKIPSPKWAREAAPKVVPQHQRPGWTRHHRRLLSQYCRASGQEFPGQTQWPESVATSSLLLHTQGGLLLEAEGYLPVPNVSQMAPGLGPDTRSQFRGASSSPHSPAVSWKGSEPGKLSQGGMEANCGSTKEHYYCGRGSPSRGPQETSRIGL